VAKLSTAGRSWIRQFDYGGITLSIGCVPNPRIEDFYAKLDPAMAKLLRSAQETGIPDGADLASFRKVNLDMVSTCILLGWENMEDEAGNQILYTPEKSREILGDERYYDLYHTVQEVARKYGDEIAEHRTKSLGNLNGSSSGS
jgi:hypothetical protein